MQGFIYRFLFFFLIIIVTYSCNSLAKIDIQVSVSPKYPVSPEIQSVTILDRSLTPEFTNQDRDSLEKILVKHDLQLDTIFHDSIAADTAIQVTAKALFESSRFDVVVPEQHNILINDNGGVLLPLDKGFIEKICKEFNTDGVLVLESFSEHMTTDFSVKRYNLGYGYGRTIREYSGIFNLLYTTVWRLYQPELDPPIIRYEVNDSIFWDSWDYSLRQMYNKLPSVKEALIGGGLASAKDIANDISPEWKDEIRKYYITGNKKIDTAIQLIKENKWKEASEIWKKYSSVASKSMRSKIEFNLALAAEMNGDIDLAINWATKSCNTKFTGAANQYLQELLQRKNTIEKNSQREKKN